MKTLTRLCLVFVMVAIASTMVYAERPQCADMTPADGPRVCFFDTANWGFDANLVRCTEPSSGTCVAYMFLSNDFIRTNPDGSQFIHITVSAADIVICPSGGFQCLLDWYFGPDFPAPLPGMFAGSAHISTNAALDPNGLYACPATAQGRGTVSNETGAAYLFVDNFVSIKNPGGEEGCTEIINNIKITPKK